MSALNIAKSSEEAAFTVETQGQLHPWMDREWLLTNGIGGYASSSVAGCNIRRYHGVLCAATLPPVGRVLALSRLAETLYLDGDRARPLELSVNQFREAVHPRGDRYLRTFSLWHTARWEYDVEGVAVTKELLLCWNRNIVGVRYTVDAHADRQIRLEVAPFTPLRDFHHSRHRNNTTFTTIASNDDGRPRVAVVDGGNRVAMVADSGTFEESPDWWYGHVFPIEADRGLDDSEDLFTPGHYTIEGNGKLQFTVWASTSPIDLPNWDSEKALLKQSRGDWSGRRTTLSFPAARPTAARAARLSPAIHGSPTGAATRSFRYRACC